MEDLLVERQHTISVKQQKVTNPSIIVSLELFTLLLLLDFDPNRLVLPSHQILGSTTN